MSHHRGAGAKELVNSVSPSPVLSSVPTDGAVAPDPSTRPGSLHVAVHNSMVAAALSVTAQRAGWQVRLAADPSSVLLTDRVPSEHEAAQVGPVVLVVEPTPYSARCAVDGLGTLCITSVVRADQPDDLESALRCLEQDRASFPCEVLHLAQQMPAVNARQSALMGAVLAGQTTAQMARGLNLSPASVKRELSRLSGLLGVHSRAALFARALELGARPEPLRP